jgi:hypothetical protein
MHVEQAPRSPVKAPATGTRGGRTEVEEEVRALQERLTALSPLHYLTDVRAPVIVLLHDRDDDGLATFCRLDDGIRNAGRVDACARGPGTWT